MVTSYYEFQVNGANAIKILKRAIVPFQNLLMLLCC